MKKPSDKITQLILNYNIRNNQNGVKLTIEAWKEDIDMSNEGLGVVYETEDEMVEGLYQILQDEWNDDNDRADDFFEDIGCSIYIVRAIEDLYKYWEWERGYEMGKDTIEEKLDVIYYLEAEELLKKAVEEEELDIEYWG